MMIDIASTNGHDDRLPSTAGQYASAITIHVASSGLKWHRTIICALLLLLLCKAPGFGQTATRVTLRPRAECHGPLITLGEIAEVNDADPNRRSNLESLDVADFPEEQSTCTVTRSLVDVRLRLMATDAAKIQVLGADRVLVRRPGGTNIDQAVLLKAQQALGESWNVDPSSVQVKLLQPLDAAALDQAASLEDLDVALMPNMRPGTNRIKVLIHDQGRLVKTCEAVVVSQLFVEQAVAKADLVRGQVLQADDVTVRWQNVTTADQQSPMAALLGKQLTVPVRAGQVIQARHVVDYSLTPPDAVKPRDRVRLLVRKGNLTVTLVGAEVLQRGAIGDQIQVRNPDSKKVIVARVVSSDEVTIQL